MTTSNVGNLEGIDDAYAVCSMYQPISNSKDSKNLSFGIDKSKKQVTRND